MFTRKFVNFLRFFSKKLFSFLTGGFHFSKSCFPWRTRFDNKGEYNFVFFNKLELGPICQNLKVLRFTRLCLVWDELVLLSPPQKKGKNEKLQLYWSFGRKCYTSQCSSNNTVKCTYLFWPVLFGQFLFCPALYYSLLTIIYIADQKLHEGNESN